MAQNRKNNHYHYAEKFDDRRRRRRKLLIPKKTAVVAALFLLIFGIVSTTFSAYMADVHLEEREHSILVDVRTAKAQKDLALTGANVDLASSGWNASSGVIYFDATGWDLTSYSKVQVMIGHNTSINGNNHSACYDMTRITGTNLYYCSPSYSGFNQLCFIANASSWSSEDNNPDHRNSYAKQYTNIWTADRSLSSANAYFFKKSSPDGDASLTLITDTTSRLNTLLNSTFELYSATKKGTGGYLNVTDGGYASMSGTTKSATGNTSTTAFSGTSTSSANPATNYPMVGSAVTVSTSANGTANASSNASKGYKFDGWYFDSPGTGTSHSGSTINMTSASNETTTLYACFSEVMHNVTVATNIPGDSSNTSNGVAGIATGYTVTAPDKTGYTFTGWSPMPSGVTITSGSTSTKSITITYGSTATTASTVTLTANYKINPPTEASIDDKTMTVGDAAVSLNPSVTIADSGATAVNSYSVTKGGAATSDATVDSSGKFSSSVPGVYTVTLSAKAQKTSGGSTLTSTAKTATATVTVLPAKPQWTLTMSGYDASGDLSNGHTYGFDAENPYLVTLGSDFSFTASINNPPNNSNYVYTWYNADDEVLGTCTSTGSSSTTKITFGSATASEATTANVVVPVKLKVTYTGADAATIYADGDEITVYYYIKSLIKSVEIPDMQKIYNTSNDAKMDIEYNIPSGSGYTTKLYASSDNVNFYEAATAAGFLGTQIGTSAVYEVNPSDQMSKNGPKYFYVNMGKTGVNARTDVLHTTVGAEVSGGTRQIYFINSSGLDLSSCRVMAFFVDSEGNTYYQTAQDVYKGISGKTENVRFRVTVPSDTVSISFGIAKASRYAIPSLSGENFDYTMGNSEAGKDNTYFVAYTSAMTTLDDAHNTIKANSKSLVSGYTDTGNDANPFYTLTTTYDSYQSAD